MAQTATLSRPAYGKRYARPAIRNAMIVDGHGTPTSGPKDIILENNMITAVVPFDPVALQVGRIGAGDDACSICQIDGFGMLRELDCTKEAGLSPINVIQHATGNNAQILGIRR
ncbi:MAG: hypothetical protein ACJ746_08595 [Bryobacteraceae bacterium]